MLPIYDKIPSGSASPSKIAGSMHDSWGKQAVLSFVLQQLTTHSGSWNPNELNQLSDILIEVRGTMTTDDRLLGLTQELIQTIEAERGP